jgi:phosphoribosylformylglycinamidine synthase
MMLSAKEEDVEKILEVFRMWDVPATPVARTIAPKRTRVFWGDELIFDMDLEFLTGGPMYCRPHTITTPPGVEDEIWPELPDRNQVLTTLLSDLNVASKEWAIRQYDHEVRGATVLRPLTGHINRAGPGDASVIQPVPGRWKGLGISVGCNPWFTALHPYHGGLSSLDEACRNLVATGCRPHSLSNCLNFGNPEKPDRLGQFREAVRGFGELARYLGLPIPSGNVSLYNEAPGGVVLPTPMIMGLGRIDDVRQAVSSDMKHEDSTLYLVGKTKNEMGGSLLYRLFGGHGGPVPGVAFDQLSTSMDRLLKAMERGLVRACHDCSDGGLAVTVAEMCIAGDIGAELNLGPLSGRDLDVALFSESNSRWVAEVPSGKENEFETAMGEMAQRIGRSGGRLFTVPQASIDLKVDDMRSSWSEPLAKMMG